MNRKARYAKEKRAQNEGIATGEKKLTWNDFKKLGLVRVSPVSRGTRYTGPYEFRGTHLSPARAQITTEE